MLTLANGSEMSLKKLGSLVFASFGNAVWLTKNVMLNCRGLAQISKHMRELDKENKDPNSFWTAVDRQRIKMHNALGVLILSVVYS